MPKKNQLCPTEGLRPDGQPAEAGWKAILPALIDKYAGTRVNGNVASHRTKAHNAIVLEAGMKLLHGELGPVQPWRPPYHQACPVLVVRAEEGPEDDGRGSICMAQICEVDREGWDGQETDGLPARRLG